MNKMKISKIREMSSPELKNELSELKAELFKYMLELLEDNEIDFLVKCLKQEKINQ